MRPFTEEEALPRVSANRRARTARSAIFFALSPTVEGWVIAETNEVISGPVVAARGSLSKVDGVRSTFVASEVRAQFLDRSLDSGQPGDYRIELCGERRNFVRRSVGHGPSFAAVRVQLRHEIAGRVVVVDGALPEGNLIVVKVVDRHLVHRYERPQLFDIVIGFCDCFGLGEAIDEELELAFDSVEAPRKAEWCAVHAVDVGLAESSVPTRSFHQTVVSIGRITSPAGF